MDADEWERSRMYPNDDDTPAPVAPRPLTTTELLQELVNGQKLLLQEQRQTNKLLMHLGKMLRPAIERAAATAIAPPVQSNNAGDPHVATDRELDSEYGNPRLKFDPRNWKGDSCIGKSMSECPVEYLDMLAESLEWQANNPRKDKATGEINEKDVKASKFKRLDAARARGWARRISNGFGQSPQQQSAGEQQSPPKGDDILL